MTLALVCMSCGWLSASDETTAAGMVAAFNDHPCSGPRVVIVGEIAEVPLAS